MNSIRMILSICSALGYVIEQLDEEVHIEIPKGMKMKKNVVLKLNKAL